MCILSAHHSVLKVHIPKQAPGSILV